ncbi:hypothetical protein DFJ73DRAFT_564714 [Zopfochytrium polystomum]|nr:hypothetical protein DFJ73DRAFT_564714 [Zopfochytrium polystomum]
MRWDNKLVGIGVGYGSMTFQTAERRFRPLRSRNDTTHHHRHSLHSSSSPPASPTAPPPRSPTATTAAASGGSGLLAYVASASTSAVATNSSVGTATAAAATEGHELLFASAGSKVYALHVETGQTVWVRQQYGPHLALLVEDGALFVVGGEEIAALDSLSGRKLWSVPNPRTGGIATVATMRSSPLTRPRNHDPSLPCPAPPPTPVPSPLLTAVFVGANGYVTLLEAERGHRIRPPQSRAATDDISVPHTWYEPVSVVPLRTSHTAIVTSRVSVRRVSLRDGRLLWDASIPGVGKTGLAGVVVGEGVPPLSRLAGQRSLRRRLRHAVSFHSDTAGRAGGFGNVEFAPGDGEDGASLAAEDVEDDGTEDGDGDDDDDGDVDDVEPLPAYTKDPETTAQQVLLAPPSPTPSMTAAPPPSLPLPSPPSSASSSATPPFTPSLPPPLPPSPPAAPAPSTFLKARPRSAPGMPSASSSSSSSQSAAPAPAAAASARHPFPPSDRLIVSVGGQTWAVDARSGRVLWKHAPFFLRRCAIGHLLADGDGKVYVAGDGRVDCLDAETGRLLWESKQIHERWAYLSTYGAGNGETNRTPDHDVLVSTML